MLLSVTCNFEALYADTTSLFMNVKKMTMHKQSFHGQIQYET